MGLITFSKVEHDFPGGIYLPPLGQLPPLDKIETVDYQGELLLPLQLGPAAAMKVTVASGAAVRAGDLVAQNGLGHYLYAPCAGAIGSTTTASVHARAAQPVMRFQPQAAALAEVANQLPPFAEPTGADGGKEEVLRGIERAGIIIPHTGRPLASMLVQHQDSNIAAVVANATPLEPELNTPLAMLHRWPSEVFAGLAILKTFLGADEAVMAYPYHFPIDTTAADTWQVRCAAVSEKYPQGRSGSVLRTLRKQGHLPIRKTTPTILVFDIQLLRQVERAVLGGQMPTHRIVTIAGDGVARPAHLIVPIGLPLTELLCHTGCYEDTTAVIMGSSMAGIAIDPAVAVIAQTSQYFSAIRSVRHVPAQRCIRCGWCISHCPAKIDPARLLQFAETEQYDRAAAIGIDRCVSCGICSYVCPSALRIMDNIIMVRRKLRSTETPEQP